MFVEIVVKRILLDSAQLVRLCSGVNGTDPVRKELAEEALHLLSTQIRAVLTLHQVMEVITHDNTDVVVQRIDFLKRLPRLCVIKSHDHDGAIGGLTDLISFEADVIAYNPGISLEKTIDVVRNFAFNDDLGSRIFRGIEEYLDILVPVFRQRLEENRSHVAIMTSDFAEFWDYNLKDSYSLAMRAPLEIPAVIGRQKARLDRDIRSKGDKRIRARSNSVAQEYMEDVEVSMREMYAAGKRPTDFYLDFLEMSLSEAPDDMTVSGLSDLFLFYKQLSGLPTFRGESIAELRSLYRPEMFPSWIVQNAQIKNYQPLSEHKGSELFDRYLTAFMPYCDVGFADAQRTEIVRRALRKDPLLRGVLGGKVRAQSDLSGLVKDLKLLGRAS